MSLEIDNKFEQVIQKFAPQSKLLRSWSLKGGISAQMTALEIAQPDGQVQKIVIRQHGPLDLKRNPKVAADEFKLLQILKAAGLSIPTPLYLDQSGEIFPTPYIIIEYIDGAPEFAPTQIDEQIPQFTSHLARIHAINCSKLDLSFLLDQTQFYSEKLRTRPAILDESLDEGHIRDVLEAAWPLTQRNFSTLLHGDYWPGNILWKCGQLAAVVDWEDAAIGDPLADIAISRLDLLWAFGIEAMQDFTRQYEALTSFDFTNLPYWDLCAALRPASRLASWAEDATSEQKMREGHRWFINQAFAKLS
ncbi:MAG TPA: phosphotransferase [Ktedonobacteraceae bacterium]|nr:phosphotransferase [Ktedonobacteraceae bacterium]